MRHKVKCKQHLQNVSKHSRTSVLQNFIATYRSYTFVQFIHLLLENILCHEFYDVAKFAVFIYPQSLMSIFLAQI